MTGVEVQIDHEPASATGHGIPGSFVPIQFDSEDPYGTAQARPAKKTPIFFPIAVVLVLSFVAVAAAALYVRAPIAGAAGAQSFQDFGAGISNATGLRGRLQVRWQGAAQYQIKIEPIDPLQSAGFSYVAANPEPGMLINIRILDSAGYALCTKEVGFSRANGKDLFQNAKDDSGKVISFSAQGILPCTAEQFRQASYWDFNTNFPAIAEQNRLMRQTALERARREEAAKRLADHRPSAGFFAQGDDGAAGYDAGLNVLESRLGRNFLVARPVDRLTANAWVASNALFHYKCDQHSRCTLTGAGGGTTIYGTAMQ
jgi:hypothetical protein